MITYFKFDPAPEVVPGEVYVRHLGEWGIEYSPLLGREGEAPVSEFQQSGYTLMREIFLQIGACSHWLRPHQTCWTAAGGFAAPVGYQGNSLYGHGLPEFDWFVILYRDQNKGRWVQAEKFFGKRKLICRVALPTRTLRHNQAAINAIWSPGTPNNPSKKLGMRYGFKRVGLLLIQIRLLVAALTARDRRALIR